MTNGLKTDLGDAAPRTGLRPAAVFLDRDGTLIEEVGYLDRQERIELFPFAVDAIRALNRARVPIVLVTNQSGIARGFFTEAVVDQVHRRIEEILRAGGATIDAYYYCPHHRHGSEPQYTMACDCRKPGRGMVDRAVAEFGIDPAQSFTIGDRWLDVALARTVGAKGVLVRTGYGVREERTPQAGLAADAVVDNLVEAASWVLETLRSSDGSADE
jgi:D-glycero-D-manno-heptose 1,7-bisphosphate phosphatase